MAARPLVVLVSGPSGGGKSTTALLLKCLLQSEGVRTALIGQDDHFIEPKNPAFSYWTCPREKETPAAVNWAGLHDELARHLARGDELDVLLVEGFLLLMDEHIMGQADALVFLQATQAACRNRRLARSRRSASEQEGCAWYYDEHVWPAFLEQTAPALAALEASDAPHPPFAVVDAVGNSIGVVCCEALRALGRLLPALAPAATAAAAADGSAHLCAAVATRDWRALAESLLPPAVSATRDQPSERRRLGLALSPLATDAIGCAVGLLEARVPSLAPVPSPPEATPSASTLLLALTLLCRLLRNACAGEPSVQAALLDDGVLLRAVPHYFVVGLLARHGQLPLASPLPRSSPPLAAPPAPAAPLAAPPALQV